jgi:transposase InsO family protein
LYSLWKNHPEWSHAQFAAAVGYCKEWVKKWLKRLQEELGEGKPLQEILQGHSRARKHPPEKTHPVVVAEILSIRDQPPEGLRRVPGQDAIHSYLERSPVLRFFQLSVPSCKTIYRILKANDRIQRREKRLHEPQERPAPMTCWQIDFKDGSLVAADPDGKRQHVVETLNIIDTGTSMQLAAHVRSDFTAETALEALALTLAKYGLPTKITLDRDPRWVGSPAGSDFPAALLRFGACLGIQIEVCAARHPQQNGFVERYNRTYQQECLALDRPTTLEQARSVTETFVKHYNLERPLKADFVWQSSTTDSLPNACSFTPIARDSGSRCLAQDAGWVAPGAQSGSKRQGERGSQALLRLLSACRTTRGLGVGCR